MGDGALFSMEGSAPRLSYAPEPEIRMVTPHMWRGRQHGGNVARAAMRNACLATRVWRNGRLVGASPQDAEGCRVRGDPVAHDDVHEIDHMSFGTVVLQRSSKSLKYLQHSVLERSCNRKTIFARQCFL